jgi:hypothetical protein
MLAFSVLAAAFEGDPQGTLGHAMEVSKEANNDVLKYRVIKTLWRSLTPLQQRSQSNQNIIDNVGFCVGAAW